MSAASLYEFRVVLPMTTAEYQVAQLYSVAEASKNETGGGEGIEVVKNEPFGPDSHPDIQPNPNGDTPLLGNRTAGQYTHKIYHLQSKVPGWIRVLAPTGSLEVTEIAWNAYPYCRTVVTNAYMKENFYIKIESMHVDDDRGDAYNTHQLDKDQLGHRQIVNINIAENLVGKNGKPNKDYKEEWDPAKYQTTRTDIQPKRGPLKEDWMKTTQPIMCAYKLVTVWFKWWGLQNKVEAFIQNSEKRIFTNFHRQVFCWTDQWYGKTMEDIRAIEEQAKADLDKAIKEGKPRGTTCEEK